MKTKRVKLKDIKFDGDNPNRLDDPMQNRLKGSMKEFGYLQPIVIDENTMICCDGEHRAKELIRKGIEEEDVIVHPFKNDAHRRAARLAFNKIHGDHLPDLDAQEYLKIIV